MKITETEVRYVATLANLKLTDGEIGKLRADLDEILSYVDKLNEVDTSAVDPMAQVLYPGADEETLRADRERPTLSNSEALENAPLSGNGCFKVPLVIER